MLLLLVMLGMLRALQFRAFAAIQLSPALNSIATPGRAVLLDLSTTNGSGPPAPLPPRQATITWPHPPAVLQRLDEDRLLAAAQPDGDPRDPRAHRVPGRAGADTLGAGRFYRPERASARPSATAAPSAAWSRSFWSA